MKAVRYHGPKTPFRLEEVPLPEPGPGEVRVRVAAAGVCHTELHFEAGLLDLGVAPLTMGHEIAGTVDALGSGVTDRAPGDRVLLYYYAGCGACEWCARGEENLCPAPRAELGFITDGGYAEYVVAPARNAVRLPDSLSFTDAAPIGCGVTTALHACALARILPGETVVVYGAGGVGFGLVQVARLRGARVIVVGRSAKKLELASSLGAEAVVNASEVKDVAARVRELTGGRGADVIFELVATEPTMAASLGALARRGRLVFVGYSEAALTVHPIQLVILEAEVLGSVGNTLAELEEAVRLVAEGKVRTVVDRTLPLESFADALDALRRGEVAGRVVLTPGG
ncbi:MAG: zinc-binding dehydrogenase [Sorangiineae bacterium]|nr:zinc-binding dehydrogenase [Polyangiaceae bacterium]MEB2322551.1 zinc-binding dehydrogenase [Sorangiineae bacterium]